MQKVCFPVKSMFFLLILLSCQNLSFGQKEYHNCDFEQIEFSHGETTLFSSSSSELEVKIMIPAGEIPYFQVEDLPINKRANFIKSRSKLIIHSYGPQAGLKLTQPFPKNFESRIQIQCVQRTLAEAIQKNSK